MPAAIGAPPKPMMALSRAALPTGSHWTYEVKWDGYRTIAQKDGRQVRLWSRNLRDVTAQYPSIAAAVGRVHARRATLDGEMVALDENGRPSFQALHHQTPSALVYYVFDILELNGRSLMDAPLEERRRHLPALMSETPVLFSEPLPGRPDDIARAVRELGLEGVVAKRADSRYEPGRRSGAWVKVRFNLRQEFVVGGYKPAGETFDSLLAGYYEGRRLLYAGKVRAGLTPQTRLMLFERLRPLAVTRCPFANLPNAKTSHWGEGITAQDMDKLCWVKPALVVEVAFVEWTRDANLRHASFVGIRDDKHSRDVTRET
jgi:bifunctional non-homologous end joining protein LigD